MPRVVHFEIPVDEPSRAIRFYESVFGWKFDKWDGPMEYWMVTTGSKEEPGIDGGLARRRQPTEATTNVVSVSSVEETTKRIESSGGKTLVPKSAVPGVGWVAYYLDPEQNVFSVMQFDPAAA